MYDANKSPELRDYGDKIIFKLIKCGKSEAWCEKVMDVWMNNYKNRINNMYKEDGKVLQWDCPLCGKRGQRINNFYGRCLNDNCLVVTTDGSIQDIRMDRI